MKPRSGPEGLVEGAGAARGCRVAGSGGGAGGGCQGNSGEGPPDRLDDLRAAPSDQGRRLVPPVNDNNDRVCMTAALLVLEGGIRPFADAAPQRGRVVEAG